MGDKLLLASIGVLVFAVAAVRCGTATDTTGDAGDASYGKKSFDSGSGVDSPFALDAASDGGDAGSSTGCGQVDTTGFTPTWQQTWQQPTPFGQGRCTDAEILSYLSACAWTGASDPTACAAKLDAGASLDCFACMAPGDGGAGPLTTAPDACHQTPSLNVGGCLANALGSTCASSWMTANECAEIACSTCMFCGGGEDIPDYVHPCVLAGGNATCDAPRAAASCALASTSPTAKTCLVAQLPQSWNDMVAFADLFCGAGPVDAGAD
jgi:hypothetical protein